MGREPATPDDVLAYCETSVEADRLTTGVGALEFERTKELILRFLEPKSAVADIGGGVGRYAEWLAAQGHRVELVDPVALHHELASERAGEPPRFGVQRGDARSLPFRDESFDAVLLLGPLYHLGDKRGRARALREAMRICRPEGLIFAAAISRFAPLLGVLRRGGIKSEQTFENVQAEMRTGRRVAVENRTAPFPDAYFHLPDELADELGAVGLHVHDVFGVEGPGWLTADFDTLWGDPVTRERLLWAARAFEREPRLIGVSAHLLAIASKPRGVTSSA